VTYETGMQELQVRKNKGTYYAKSSMVNGVYKVDSDLGQAIDKELDDFRNKKVFDVGFDDPSKVEMHSGGKAYFLSRSGGDWWSNGKKMDAGSVQVFLSRLRDLTASRFVDSGFTSSAIEVAVTSDGGERVEKVSIAKSGNGYIAKRENESALYELGSSSVEALQKAVDDVKPATSPSK
jgi:Domain of unknown function (DUF4340)